MWDWVYRILRHGKDTCLCRSCTVINVLQQIPTDVTLWCRGTGSECHVSTSINCFQQFSSCLRNTRHAGFSLSFCFFTRILESVWEFAQQGLRCFEYFKKGYDYVRYYAWWAEVIWNLHTFTATNLPTQLSNALWLMVYILTRKSNLLLPQFNLSFFAFAIIFPN